MVQAVRASHDRLADIVAGLDGDALRARSYDKEWSIADVLSHLGSGAEIFSLILNAALSADKPPTTDDFKPIWDTWNARSPEDQATESVAANEALIARAEGLSPKQQAAFHVKMLGDMPMGLVGFLGMRLSEHAVHTWDIEVALDPAATVAPDAVDFLIDRLPFMVGLTGKKAPAPVAVAVTTTDPNRAYTLDTGGVTLALAGATATTASLVLPAEAFLRLVYGRLDAEAGVTASGITLAELKSVFPGF